MSLSSIVSAEKGMPMSGYFISQLGGSDNKRARDLEKAPGIKIIIYNTLPIKIESSAIAMTSINRTRSFNRLRLWVSFNSPSPILARVL